MTGELIEMVQYSRGRRGNVWSRSVVVIVSQTQLWITILTNHLV